MFNFGHIDVDEPEAAPSIAVEPIPEAAPPIGVEPIPEACRVFVLEDILLPWEVDVELLASPGPAGVVARIRAAQPSPQSSTKGRQPHRPRAKAVTSA